MIAHCSTSSSLSHEPSFCGVRPQNTATGMRSMSSAGSAAVSQSCARAAAGPAVAALVPEAARPARDKRRSAARALPGQTFVRARELQATQACCSTARSAKLAPRARSTPDACASAAARRRPRGAPGIAPTGRAVAGRARSRQLHGQLRCSAAHALSAPHSKAVAGRSSAIRKYSKR